MNTKKILLGILGAATVLASLWIGSWGVYMFWGTWMGFPTFMTAVLGVWVGAALYLC